MTNYLKTDFDYNSDALVEVFDELPIWAAPFGLKLLDNIQYKKNITALDIGFGAGFPLTELAMRLGKTCKIIGIDPWEAAVKRAEKKISFYGITNSEIIRGVAEQIPIADNSIDLITSNNGLNNVTDLHKALKECYRVMKKGGQFIQTLNLEGTMMEFYSAMETVLKEFNMQKEIDQMKEQIHKKRKPLNDLVNLIESSGFKTVNIIHDQFNYTFVDGTTMLNHYFIKMAFIDGWKSFIPENKHAEIFTHVENLMNEIAAKDGNFKLSVPFVLIDCKKNS